jgi:hypothetical protein
MTEQQQAARSYSSSWHKAAAAAAAVHLSRCGKDSAAAVAAALPSIHARCSANAITA